MSEIKEFPLHNHPLLLDALQSDPADLTALHAPAGSERSVIAWLRDLFCPLVDTVEIDHLSNLSTTCAGPADAPIWWWSMPTRSMLLLRASNPLAPNTPFHYNTKQQDDLAD